MAKKERPKITVNSYVRRKDGTRVKVDDLNEQERRYVAGQISAILLNEFYKGVAVFYPQEREAAP